MGRDGACPGAQWWHLPCCFPIICFLPGGGGGVCQAPMPHMAHCNTSLPPTSARSQHPLPGAEPGGTKVVVPLCRPHMCCLADQLGRGGEAHTRWLPLSPPRAATTAASCATHQQPMVLHVQLAAGKRHSSGGRGWWWPPCMIPACSGQPASQPGSTYVA